MKIFAKRTRTVVDAETASRLREKQEAAEERDGEKAIQELLKLDPSTLNSKQRRMIKRNKERDEPEQSASAMDVKNNESSDSETKSSDVVNEEAVDASSKNSNVQAVSEDSKADEVSDTDVVDKQTIEDKVNENSSDEVVVENKPVAENDLNEENVKKLLEGLNSKQRRKLMRQLEREGTSVLGEVHQEALRLTEENKADAASADASDKRQDKGQSATPSSSGEKRKGDWSDLSPEERLRREEQRLKQKEAAERRAKEGNGNSKRHPLNSERRRANRRKPKWERKQLVENEHDTSGYHMRKITKA